MHEQNVVVAQKGDLAGQLLAQEQDEYGDDNCLARAEFYLVFLTSAPFIRSSSPRADREHA